MTKINVLPPSLTAELADLKRRLSSLERAPSSDVKFDRYPSVDGQFKPRGTVKDNVWSSASIANVTGLVYDRVEVKFQTLNLAQDRAEPEIRLAAFRNNYEVGVKQIISASSAVRLSPGNRARNIIGTVLIRWEHGIPHGWDYEEDNSVLTIELQHRYVKRPVPDPAVQMYGIIRDEGSGGDASAMAIRDRDDRWRWAPSTADAASNVRYGWRQVGTPWDGRYSISDMHYCVGFSASRIPASPMGLWRWIGVDVTTQRLPDISEDYIP